MSDIVERLREWSTCNVFPEQAQYVISEACLEITTLRAEINEAQKREACAFDLSREWEAHCKTAEAQRDSLRAENERLRAALDAICIMDISWIGDAFKLKDTARAALEESKG